MIIRRPPCSAFSSAGRCDGACVPVWCMAWASVGPGVRVSLRLKRSCVIGGKKLPESPTKTTNRCDLPMQVCEWTLRVKLHGCSWWGEALRCSTERPSGSKKPECKSSCLVFLGKKKTAVRRKGLLKLLSPAGPNENGRKANPPKAKDSERSKSSKDQRVGESCV